MKKITYKYEPPVAVLEQSSFPEAMARLKEAGVGGFDIEKRTFSPLNFDYSIFDSEKPVYECDIFDAVAGAIEAGIVSEEMWPTELFSNSASFNEFVSLLADFESCYKLYDPWWQAFKTLLQSVEEEGYATAADLAERFSEALSDLPEQW